MVACLWAAAAAGLALRLSESFASPIAGLALVGVTIAAVMAVMIPAGPRNDLVGIASEALGRRSSDAANAARVNKIEHPSHFLMFAGLTVFAGFAWFRTSVAALTVGLVLFACATETLQFYAPGRWPSWGDLVTDFQGVGVAALGVLMFRLRRVLGRSPFF